VLEVADIQDELRMIRQLIQTQRNVLRLEVAVLIKSMNESVPNSQKEQMPFLNFLIRNNQNDSTDDGKKTGITQHYLESVDERLISVLTEIDEIKEEAESTHKSVSVTVELPCLC
jgi:hypothetical protein